MELSALVSQMELGPFTEVAVFLHHYAYSLVAVLSLMTAAYFRRRGRYYALALSMVLAILLSLALKAAYGIPRPCNDWLENPKVECPQEYDYGFPSGHTAFAFVFVGASLGTGVFPLYMLIGIVVGFSRVYLGVHSITDVAGGAIAGVLVYLFCEECVDFIERRRLNHGKK